MKSFKFRRLVIFLTLITVLLIGCSSTALAAPHLDWQTTDVYYDGDQLVVRGYFYNNGTSTINRVDSVHLNVYFRQHGTDWWMASAATWYNFDVYLAPGETSGYYKLRINNPNYYKFDFWRVNGSVRYHTID